MNRRACPGWPTTKLMQRLAKKHGMCSSSHVRGRSHGHLLQHDRRHRCRCRYLASIARTTSRTATRLLEKFTSSPATSAIRVRDAIGKVGVYTCYDRHFPKAGGCSG